MKSSAASISILPGLSGREAIAINPSGLPVLTITLSAAAGMAVKSPMANNSRERLRNMLRPPEAHALRLRYAQLFMQLGRDRLYRSYLLQGLDGTILFAWERPCNR